MTKVAVLAVVLIVGPMLNDARAPGSLEEAWHIERLYGPPQRWTIDVVPAAALKALPAGANEALHVRDVDGIRFAVLTSITVDHLGIELWGDRLRVYEIDG